jgi:hypothetical protein
MHVDPDVLEQKLEQCQAIHAGKRRMKQVLEEAGLDGVLVRDEDLLSDEADLMRRMLVALGHDPAEHDLRDALALDIHVKRVHGEDLSEFFLNADELLARFSDRFEVWQ